MFWLFISLKYKIDTNLFNGKTYWNSPRKPLTLRNAWYYFRCHFQKKIRYKVFANIFENREFSFIHRQFKAEIRGQLGVYLWITPFLGPFPSAPKPTPPVTDDGGLYFGVDDLPAKTEDYYNSSVLSSGVSVPDLKERIKNGQKMIEDEFKVQFFITSGTL